MHLSKGTKDISLIFCSVRNPLFYFIPATRRSTWVKEQRVNKGSNPLIRKSTHNPVSTVQFSYTPITCRLHENSDEIVKDSMSCRNEHKKLKALCRLKQINTDGCYSKNQTVGSIATFIVVKKVSTHIGVIRPYSTLKTFFFFIASRSMQTLSATCIFCSRIPLLSDKSKIKFYPTYFLSSTFS